MLLPADMPVLEIFWKELYGNAGFFREENAVVFLSFALPSSLTILCICL